MAKKLGEKRIQFRQLMLDEIFFLKKMKIVHGISGKSIPRKIRSIIGGINDLRNDLTHSRNPGYRQRYAESRVVGYRKSFALYRIETKKLSGRLRALLA